MSDKKPVTDGVKVPQRKALAMGVRPAQGVCQKSVKGSAAQK